MDASQKRPTAGVRYALERADDDGAATIYRGFAHVPDADLPIEVRVEQPSGEPGVVDRSSVRASIDAAAAEGGHDVPGLEKAAAALVKAAARAARDAGRPLPRRIVRWRN
jgi:hypothetical protein